MRAHILIVSALLFVACASQSEPWTSPRWDEAVIVRKWKEDFPAKKEDSWHFLASRFINNKEVDAFETLTTAQWKEWLPLFEDGLVKKAKEASLDAESLQQCLALVAASNHVANVAYLPVGAYATRQGEVPVWIIAAKWEFKHSDPDAKEPGSSSQMVHTRVFAFDARKRSVIGFATCH
jgi:hypothetical protein